MFARAGVFLFCFFVAGIYTEREQVGKVQYLIHQLPEIPFPITVNTIHTGAKSSGLAPKS